MQQILSSLFHAFIPVKSWCLHYPQCNSTANSWYHLSDFTQLLLETKDFKRLPTPGNRRCSSLNETILTMFYLDKVLVHLLVFKQHLTTYLLNVKRVLLKNSLKHQVLIKLQFQHLALKLMSRTHIHRCPKRYQDGKINQKTQTKNWKTKSYEQKIDKTLYDDLCRN